MKNKNMKTTHKINSYNSIAPIVMPETPSSLLSLEETKTKGTSHLLTEDQKLLVLLASMGEKESTAYNSSTTIKLRGHFSLNQLKEAIHFTVGRHSALRGVISENRLLIKNKICEDVHFLDFSHESRKNELLKTFLRDESKKNFNIQKSMFRVSVIRMSSEEHLLTITAHHIICDGVSIGIILQDIAAAYTALAKGDVFSLPPVMQFSEFANWRNNNHQNPKIVEQETYWLEKTTKKIPPLELPFDRPRPSMKSYAGGRITSRLPKSLNVKLRKFSNKRKCTPFMTLFAAYSILLHRISEQTKFNVGVAFAGRTIAGSEELVGYCSTIYPITSIFNEDMSVNDYLMSLKNELLDAYDHQDYPFARLIGKSGKLRDSSRSYFFSVAFNWDRVFIPSMGELEVSYFPQPISSSEYDLMPNVMEVNNELIISWDYNTDLFDESTILSISRAFNSILTNVLAQENQTLKDIPLIESYDYEKFVLEYNDNNSTYSEDLCIHNIVEQAAFKYKENLAITFKDKSLTYSELDKLSNRYANTILEILTGMSQKKVAVLLNSNLNLIPILIGILKSGNIYVPINPEFPKERIWSILEDSEASILFTDSSEVSIRFSGVIINLKEKKFSPSLIDTPCKQHTKPSDLAYIIYTAGSTGVPKGVQIRHRSVINLLEFMQKKLNLCHEDVICSVSNVATDMSVPDYYLPGLVGASVVLIDKEDRLDLSSLIHTIEKTKTSLLQISPTLLKSLINNGWEGNPDHLQIISGAEPLPSSVAESLLSKCKALWNWYGPTETTVWSTFKRVETVNKNKRFVSIGSPIQNTTVYVLDKYKNPMPNNIPGELYIGGEGLSLGYLKKENLNQKYFVENIFSKDFSSKLYKTGDKIRMLSNGELEYQGRLDFQVKIRGNRVEIGEIESLLKSHNDIEEAAVVPYKKDDNLFLVAYVKSKNTKNKKGIFSFLRKKLPEYMLPSYLEYMPNFTYTDNGKLNRSTLPTSFEPKENKNPSMLGNLNSQIADIWCKVLGHSNFMIDEDFFMVGGNSLLLVEVYNQIKKTFKSSCCIKDLFKHTTIEQISEFLENAQE